MSSNDNITEFGALLKFHINLSQIDYCNNISSCRCEKNKSQHLLPGFRST